MSNLLRTWLRVLPGTAVAAALAWGCGNSSTAGGGPTPGPGQDVLSGPVAIDGSSTVGPIMAAAAEEFQIEQPKTEPAVGTSGTSGGFKKFIAGEIDIAGASRPIKPEEVAQLEKAGIEFVEVPVAMDGLTIVVNPKNTWATSLTLGELKRIWEPGSRITNWSQVRAGFPNKPIKLFGAGTDSGTFDYFTLAVVGKEKSSREDYTMSEDDNVLVAGVQGEEGALGYFGFSYYVENKDKLRAVAVDAGKGPVSPSFDAILDGTYTPLSRPLLAYVNKESLEKKPQVKAFVEFLLEHNDDLVRSAQYIPLSEEVVTLVKAHVSKLRTGTKFAGTESGLSIKDVLARESEG
jgi:phosphate transport system substrate-binding protein